MSETHLLDIAEFARLEEPRQAKSVAVVADVTEPIGSGMMSFAGVGSWANQASGLGMNGPVSAGEIDRFIAFYESRGVEPYIKVCPLADETLIARLAQRRFVLREFETVLVRELPGAALPPMPEGIDVVPVDTKNENHIEQCISIKAAGFAPDRPEVFMRLARRALLAGRTAPFFAAIDGKFVSAGSCEMTSPCAALFGVTTLEAYRRRGCQRALMIARLRAAVEKGCRYACIHSGPHLATGRNAQRLGFVVAYTKAILVRPGAGLAPSP